MSLQNALLIVSLASVLISGGGAVAQSITTTYPAPAFDRYMYAFVSGGGTRPTASVFSALGFERLDCAAAQFPQGCFDTRDAQMTLGFATAPAVPAGLPAANYRVRSARLAVTFTENSVYRYDGTFDPLSTYLDTDPSPDVYAPVDPDPGRPIELHGAGYRNGVTLASVTENTPYGGAQFPSKFGRSVFPAQFDATGTPIDVSNNVDRILDVFFESEPLAVGIVAGATPGENVPALSVMTFAVNVASANNARYLRESLAAGKLVLVLSTLDNAEGPADTTLATFYTKEAGIPGTAPRLDLDVCVGPPGDWNCSGTKGVEDIFAFLTDWFAGSAAADFNLNGATDVSDIFAFLAAWFA